MRCVRLWGVVVFGAPVLLLLLVAGPLLSAPLQAPVMAATASAATTTTPAPPVVDLSDAQKQKLTALHSASHAQSQELYRRLGQATAQLYQIYGAYALDPKDARRLNQEINRIQEQLLDLRLSEQQQLRQILSSDQFAQLQAGMHPHEGWEDSGGDHRHHDHAHPSWPPS